MTPKYPRTRTSLGDDAGSRKTPRSLRPLFRPARIALRDRRNRDDAIPGARRAPRPVEDDAEERLLVFVTEEGAVQAREPSGFTSNASTSPPFVSSLDAFHAPRPNRTLFCSRLR